MDHMSFVIGQSDYFGLASYDLVTWMLYEGVCESVLLLMFAFLW